MTNTSEDMNRAMEEGREEEFERVAPKIVELETRNQRLREALIECKYSANKMRIWMGVDGWRYHPIHAKKIAEVASKALEES